MTAQPFPSQDNGTMHGLLLSLHSALRWAVIILGLFAAARGLIGGVRRASWSTTDDRAGLLFTIGLDLQVLIGLTMYALVSPITTSAFQNMGAAMQNGVVRFWIVEHPVAMLLALALAHVGRARIRRASEPPLKHRRAAILYGCAILLVLLGTPWPFMRVARPLFRLVTLGFGL